MRVAIHQPQYLPYLGFFHKIRSSDLFVALDTVQFQKGGHQNRNRIKTRDGAQWITVPVLHQHGQSISDVTINPRVNWNRKHAQALLTNYAPTPGFDVFGTQLLDRLDDAYRSLCTLNMTLIRWAMEALGITTPIVMASDLSVSGQATELLVNICLATGCEEYLSGPGGRRYMELELFEQAGISVHFQDFEPPVYAQYFNEQPFLPNLSVVDALFCCGREAAGLLI